MNLHVPGADALLQRFAFVPQARLDDVMVSYATPGGGVGPHVDRYDVFLLQGPGRRAWRVEGRTISRATGRPALPAAGRAARRRGARALLHLLDRLSRAARRRARRRVPRLAARARPAGRATTAIRGWRRRARPGAVPDGDGLFRRRRLLEAHPLVAPRRGALPRRIPERAQAARGVQARGSRRARLRELAGAPRREDAPALPRRALLHQRREPRTEREARCRPARTRRPPRAAGRAACPARASPV